MKNCVQLYRNETNLHLIEDAEDEELDHNEETGKNITIKDEDIQRALNCELFFKFRATEFCKRFKHILSTNDVTPKDVMNYSIARLSRLIERILKKWDKVYKPLCFAVVYCENVEYKRSAIMKIRKLEKVLAKFLFEVVDSLFFLYATNKRINTTLKTMELLNKIIIYLDNPYSIKLGQSSSTITRFSEYIREIIFKKIKDEISLVLKTAPINEKVQLETLYFLILLKQLNAKYHISAKELETHLMFEDGRSKLPKLNAIAVITLLYYMGFKKDFQNLKQTILDQTLKSYEAISPNRIKISAEYVILALDLAACPYIKRSIRIKFLQKIGLSQKEGGIVVDYLKKQKFLYTKWTGVNVTKELNAKISQEVYS